MCQSKTLPLAGALVATVMTLGGCSIGNFIGKEKATKTSKFTLPLPESGKCRIQSQNGAIRCVAGSVSEIEVEALTTARASTVEQAKASLERIEIGRKETAEGAEIVANIPKGVSGSVSFQVTVPFEMALNLETTNGAIEVTGVSGDVTCHTSNGATQVIGCSGAVNTKTSNGKITVEGETLASLQARTSNGSVHLKGGLLPGSHEVHTSNGSIHVELAGMPVIVTATTSNGSMTANGEKLKKGEAVTLGLENGAVIASDSAVAELSLRTSNGSVKVTHRGESDESSTNEPPPVETL